MRVPQEMVVEQLLVGCEAQRGKQAVFDAAPEAQGVAVVHEVSHPGQAGAGAGRNRS